MTRQLSTSVGPSVFAPGTLWDRLLATTADARQSGALEPIETRGSYCEDRGIRFLMRMVANLKHKPRGDENRNPFLPYERALYVADASDTHVCVLNKYNVVDHHLLIITRAFEHQEEMLNTADFQALWRCLLEYESLGFYNSGRLAGASQPHKHLQLVPLPLISRRPGAAPTLDLLFDTVAAPPETVTRVPGLPFRHLLARFDVMEPADADRRAATALDLYREMLIRLGVELPRAARARIATPYNLLVSRRWMLVVPRLQECCHAISLNALAFAGTLLVQDAPQLQQLRAAGPLTALTLVAGNR